MAKGSIILGKVIAQLSLGAENAENGLPIHAWMRHLVEISDDV
jgi:hypothetical protein